MNKNATVLVREGPQLIRTNVLEKDCQKQLSQSEGTEVLGLSLNRAGRD